MAWIGGSVFERHAVDAQLAAVAVCRLPARGQSRAGCFAFITPLRRGKACQSAREDFVDVVDRAPRTLSRSRMSETQVDSYFLGAVWQLQLRRRQNDEWTADDADAFVNDRLNSECARRIPGHDGVRGPVGDLRSTGRWRRHRTEHPEPRTWTRCSRLRARV